MGALALTRAPGAHWLSGRKGNGPLDRPATEKTLSQQTLRKSKLPIPLFDIHGASVESQGMVVGRSIVGLGNPVSPTTVSGLVSSRAINSVERKSRWATPHMNQERRERVPPFLAHLNALSAITSVIRPGWCVASTFSLAPGVVFPGSVAALSMGFVSDSGEIIPQATTTARLTEPQSGAWNRDFFPALTAAKPSSATLKPWLMWGRTNHREPSEHVTGFISEHASSIA